LRITEEEDLANIDAMMAIRTGYEARLVQDYFLGGPFPKPGEQFTVGLVTGHDGSSFDSIGGSSAEVLNFTVEHRIRPILGFIHWHPSS
jgi:hypothetical protein